MSVPRPILSAAEAGALLDAIEPQARCMSHRDELFHASAAISLKRIADALERIEGGING